MINKYCFVINKIKLFEINLYIEILKKKKKKKKKKKTFYNMNFLFNE